MAIPVPIPDFENYTIDASRITNTDHSHILDCCNEKPYRHTAGGCVWKFERSDDLSQSQF